MTEGKVSITKLNNQNYQVWKFKVEMYLTDKDLWQAVSQSRPTDETAGIQWDKRNVSAKAKISLLVEDDQLIHIKNEPTAREMWLALKKVHERSNLNSKLFLLRKLYGMRFNNGDDMQEHIRKISEVIDRLRGLGSNMEETNIVAILLCSLPDEYDSLITALEARPDAELTLEYVTGKLIDAYDRRKEKSSCYSSSAESALKIVNKERKCSATERPVESKARGREPRECFHCGKVGHIKRHCFKWKALKRSFKANTALESDKNEQCNTSEQDLCFKIGANSQTEGWFIDSGASAHMTNKLDFFYKLDSNRRDHVTIANGAKIPVTGVGSGRLRCFMGNGNSKIIEVHDVFYVPDLEGSLLSVQRLANKGFAVEFTDKHCFIRKNNTIIAEAECKTNLYKLNCENVAKVAITEGHENCIHKWHRRLGHRHPDAIQKMVNNNLAEGLDMHTCNVKLKCTCCVEGKLTKTPFPRVSEGSSEVGELIHSDICGPMKTPTPRGNRYILTLTDDCSRYLTVYLLKHKSEATEKLEEYVALIQNKFGRPPKVLRTDRGGEFVNNRLDAFLRKHGIQHQLTVPYSPEQNGVAERRNRYLLEMVRSMLTDSGLNNKYWGEAVMTAAYLQNLLPTKSVKVTPYEVWNQKKPNVGHIRIFGCQAFYHVPAELRTKLDNKGKEGILVGYCQQSKGYRILDVNTDKVIISRSVVFIESDKQQILKNRDEARTPETVPVNLNGKPSSEEELPVTSDQSKGPRRSPRINKGVPPERYICAYKAEIEPPAEPCSWNDMMTLEQNEQEMWLKATKEEINSLEEKHVWELTELPKGKQAIDSKWVFKLKQDNEGKTNRYKARLVAKGYKQKPGEEYGETYAPVATSATFRTLLTVASVKKLNVVHYDVKTAFLNGEIKEEIYMKQPEGYIKAGFEDLVLKLRKGLYGLKQSAKSWNDKINELLTVNGYKRSKADPCLYSKQINSEWTYLLVYVDDIIGCFPNSEIEDEVMELLNKEFETKCLGKISFYLGIQIERSDSGCFIIHQSTKIRQILERFGMNEANPTSTPMEPEFTKNTDTSEELPNNWKYQEAIGALLYLSTMTRPDITTAVGILCRKTNKPTTNDWQALKRVMRYLRHTINRKLSLGGENNLHLTGHVDADWAGDSQDRKSTSGYIFQVGKSAVTWASRKQPTVALSSSEAEFIAASQACREVNLLLQLLSDMGVHQELPITLFEDNQSCIAMVNGDKVSQRAKHIDVKYHYIRDLREKGIIELCYCPTKTMLADIFTKPLGKVRFTELCYKLCMYDVPFEEGC